MSWLSLFLYKAHRMVLIADQISGLLVGPPIGLFVLIERNYRLLKIIKKVVFKKKLYLCKIKNV